MFDDMFSCVDTIRQRDVTDRQTDTQTHRQTDGHRVTAKTALIVFSSALVS